MVVKTRWMAVLAGLALASSAGADAIPDEQRAQEDRIAELERIVEVLADELDRTRDSMALPEDPELIPRYGRGPGASKVYGLAQGLSIGGYGEMVYQHFFGEPEKSDRWDSLRTVLYVGYKFTDRIVFNTEIEFEHATSESTQSSGDGSVSVEFATLDFMLKDWANARVGLLLIPMGFVNEIHEPPFFYGVLRPEPERRIIPSTWSENGTGFFGDLFGETVEYEMYVVNGFNAAGFDAAGLRDGRQQGNRALAEDVAFVSQVNWWPTDDLMVGGAAYYGKSGQNQTLMSSSSGMGVDVPNAPTTLWEVHAQWERWGLHLRGLFTMAHVSGAGDLTTALRATGDIDPTETVAERMLGGYAEIAYDVLPLLFGDTVSQSLSPYYRYEYTDTQNQIPAGFVGDPTETIWNHVVGLEFSPIENVVIKTDVRLRDSDGGNVSDEFNIGVGFVF